ncbi:MAG: ribonuclease III domain-containing protein [Clostridia bacterium]|nr:ribonuclease III domain-containing protein [Clostridia bacterium]
MFKLGDVLTKEKANSENPIVLAFIGDAVYSLYVREKLVFTSDFKTGELSLKTIENVRATSQARFFKKIESLLTEEEIAVYKRARNAKKTTRSKSATVAEYNSSTGFEALLGYLYITGNLQRLNYLLNAGEENES